MKKCLVLFCVFCTGLGLRGQDREFQKKYTLQTSNTTFGASLVNLQDGYLSPLPYSGFGLKVAHENRRFRSPYNTSLSTYNRTRFDIGTALNPSYTASMVFLGGNFAWGMHYHFRPLPHMQVLAGGLWDVELGFKSNLRNVNNPVNIDLGTNLNLSAVLIYDIPLRRRTLRLQASLDTPFIGCMFAPAQGASYYEIFSLGASGHFVHFSSWHNKLALRQNYFIEIPFANSCWRFGICSDIMKYRANDLFFCKNDFTVYFGYTRTLSRFTRRNMAPENFIGI